jgi:hypothetical protein
MGDSARQVLLHRQELSQSSIPWICPVQLQQTSGLREAYGIGENKYGLGGVVWVMYQSASSKWCWLPDAVDILNIVMVEDSFQDRLKNICAFLRESFKNTVSVLNTSNDFLENEQTSVSSESSYSVDMSQATRCQFAAICHHYDLFSGSITSLFVSMQQQQQQHLLFSLVYFFAFRRFPQNASTSLGGHSMNFVKVSNILDRDFSSLPRYAGLMIEK